MCTTPTGEEVGTQSEFAERRNNGSAMRQNQIRPTFITSLTARLLGLMQICSSGQVLEALDKSTQLALPGGHFCKMTGGQGPNSICSLAN